MRSYKVQYTRSPPYVLWFSRICNKFHSKASCLQYAKWRQIKMKQTLEIPSSLGLTTKSVKAEISKTWNNAYETQRSLPDWVSLYLSMSWRIMVWEDEVETKTILHNSWRNAWSCVYLQWVLRDICQTCNPNDNSIWRLLDASKNADNMIST